MTETLESSHRPWMASLVMGAGFLLIGSLPMMLLWREASSRTGFLTICLASCVIGIMILSKVWVRYRGTLVEQRAIRRLRLPEGWSMDSNVKLNRDGDLDLLVVNSDHQRYAVEIKSYQGVKLKRARFGWTEELRYRDGRSFSKDPVKQVLRAAEETNALPVIWLPEAPSAKTIHMQCGVQVVQGSSRDLLKAMGKKRGWF